MKLSLIIPCYNEEENIKKLYEIIIKELKDIPYELLFIDDGSKDNTYKIINELYNKDPDHVKSIAFSRNFGKEAAIYAGIKNSIGEYTCIIDADLQQHPKYVLEMMKYLDNNEDTDQVAMYVKKRKDKPLRNVFSSLYYKLINYLSDTKFSDNVSDFRMFRSDVKNAILELTEVNRFSKGIFSWVGFNAHTMPYEVAKREHGKTKFNFKSLTTYAIDGIVGYSIKPLRIITLIGFITSIGAFIYLLLIIIKKIFFVVDVPGYSSIISVLLFFSGVQILSIGILGEYLSRTYSETKKRPIYLEKNKIGFKDSNIL